MNGGVTYHDMEERRDAIDRLKFLETLRPASEWHEDIGPVLWWHLPICEPPEVGCGEAMDERDADGMPGDCARLQRSGWLTHWSPIPQVREL